MGPNSLMVVYVDPLGNQVLRIIFHVGVWSHGQGLFGECHSSLKSISMIRNVDILHANIEGACCGVQVLLCGHV